jgi:hypothetical protein
VQACLCIRVRVRTCRQGGGAELRHTPLQPSPCPADLLCSSKKETGKKNLHVNLLLWTIGHNFTSQTQLHIQSILHTPALVYDKLTTV